MCQTTGFRASQRYLPRRRGQDFEGGRRSQGQESARGGGKLGQPPLDDGLHAPGRILVFLHHAPQGIESGAPCAGAHHFHDEKRGALGVFVESAGGRLVEGGYDARGQ